MTKQSAPGLFLTLCGQIITDFQEIYRGFLEISNKKNKKITKKDEFTIE
jgi:hypothetical protein